MKILYNNSNIYGAVYDNDWFKFSDHSGAILDTFEIDEIDPTNKTVCNDIANTLNKTNEAGERKYYVLNGELYERENWVEFIEII